MAFPFPLGVSGLLDPDDETYIELLEACAESRRRLGMPSYTREELEQFFSVKDAPAPESSPEDFAPNVIALSSRRRGRR